MGLNLQSNLLSSIDFWFTWSACMVREKQLVFGSEKLKAKVENEVKGAPVMLGKVVMKEKHSEAYFEDILFCQGLRPSTEASIRERTAKVKGSIYGRLENAVCRKNDCRHRHIWILYRVEPPNKQLNMNGNRRSRDWTSWWETGHIL